MKLLYPTSIALNVDTLKSSGVSPHPYDVAVPIPEEHTDAEILIVWAVPFANLQDAASRLKNLRFIQSLAAGPNDVLAAGFNIGPGAIQLCTGSGLHDHTVSEHALGLLLSAARKFHEMRDWQLQGKWPQHLGGIQRDRPKDAFTTLREARVLIWGFGNIAKTLAPLLRALGAEVRGVARSAGTHDGVEVFGEDALPELLPQTDALVMILPGAAETRHALNAERLAMLPKHAWLVNVGRGMSVDEAALLGAIRKGEIGGAALDVFDVEPLPAESEFWKEPNVIVSPHAAGGRPQGAEALIVENLRRLLAGQELKNQV